MPTPAAGRPKSNEGWCQRKWMVLSSSQRNRATNEPTVSDTGMTNMVQRSRWGRTKNCSARFFTIQYLFEVDQPFSVDTHDPDSRGVFFEGIGIGIGRDGVVYRLDIDRQNVGVPVFFLFFMVQALVILFPFCEEHLVGGVWVQEKTGFFVVAIQRGADKLTSCILGVFGFFKGMRVAACCPQQQGGEDKFVDHVTKVKKKGTAPDFRGPCFNYLFSCRSMRMGGRCA